MEENNQPQLETIEDKITNDQDKDNKPSEETHNKTEVEDSTKEVQLKGEETSTDPTIVESKDNSDVIYETKLVKESTVASTEPHKESKEEVIEDTNTQELMTNDPKSNDRNENDNQSIIPNVIQQSYEDQINNENESISKASNSNKEQEIIKLESVVIIEEEKETETDAKDNKSKPKPNKIDHYKPKTSITAKKIIPPKNKATRNNKSEIYNGNSHNLSLMASVPTSPKGPRVKKGMLSSKAKEQAEQQKLLNATTIETENRPEIFSTIIKSSKKDEIFNTTYQRFQDKMKEKGDKIDNLRKKIEEKERNGLTGIPKINKSKMAENDSDFLSRQKKYEEKVKEKKDKLASEAKSKIDKELNIVSKQSKANKEDVKHSLIHFKEWEEKKNKKINEMKSEKEKKEIDQMNNEKLHKGAKCNIDDSCKRLYQDDVKKRLENKKMLQTMFKPAFKPTINSGKKKIPKDKEINSEKSKYKALDRGLEKKKENDKANNEKNNELSSSEQMNTQVNESVNYIEEDSKIITTEFLTESNTDALREKLFRKRPKFAMNQSSRGTQPFSLDNV